MACLESDSLVLDVGSGSGVVARTAIHNMHGTGKVIAIDLSAGMLEVARQNTIRAEMGDRLQLCRMDAERLDFADGSIDRVLSLFAFLHFPNL